ncbi:D-alanyl-D-alanine carboxypeptidase [Ornithinimicrobium sufpigmenti]|uniref:D-alanyl-D-alanine carboxypeptidase n=1 Tax=Ornithinimicrobium sufpigmenti TaxID=2508882 RepID=UPI001036AA37|nr:MULTISPECIES: D-alanyl-D-alanine carboxypeptidase [unclassified Ornithinimicrobium]
MRYAVTSAVVGALLLGAVQGGGAAASTDAETTEPVVSTHEPAATGTDPAETTTADARPRPNAFLDPLGDVRAAPVPERGPLALQIAEELDSRWLGPSNRRSIAIRDALTGESLADRHSGRPVTPASTTKLLSAAAIVSALDPATTFTTRVVTGERPGEVVLVAGGDMLLADGEGDPEAVAGHAGIGDLAAQTAAALRAGENVADGAASTASAEAGTGGPVTVSLDLSHVSGPHVMPTWSDHWVDEGWTGRIVQLGRAGDRALPYDPSPREPEQEVARVFREALAGQGLDVTGAGGSDGESVRAEVVTAPAAAVELAAVESAALRDVLALASATSDNAMFEQLARQAAVAAGRSPDQESVMAWVRETMTEDLGLDLTGMRIADASGLSDGTLLSMEVVAEVLVAAADGSHPHLQEVLAAGGLPIAGYTGTLGNGMRFHLPVHAPAVGNARAKTGTLPGVTALAGTVVTADGRLLAFAVAADDIESGSAALEAASVLDEIVAELARCGC